MYTISDLTSRGITYQFRTYGARGFFPQTEQGLIFFTIDGKYCTSYPDSDGYSYWLEIRDGDISNALSKKMTDIVFGCEQGKIDAVNVLNRLIGGN
jgi:hypothetical protein